MPEKVAPGPVHDANCIREAVCIDTKKIFDSCKEEDIASLSRQAPTKTHPPSCDGRRDFLFDLQSLVINLIHRKP